MLTKYCHKAVRGLEDHWLCIVGLLFEKTTMNVSARLHYVSSCPWFWLELQRKYIVFAFLPPRDNKFGGKT